MDTSLLSRDAAFNISTIGSGYSTSVSSV